jgi:uncharacterized membrane protein YkoI
MRNTQRALLGGTILAAVLAGGAFGAALTGTAIAATETPSAGATDTSQGGHVGSNGTAEVPLTGDTAAKVTAAVTAKYPDATIERLETDSDGAAYEAHVTLADGSRATVKLDESFAITGTETGHRHGDGSRGGHGGRGGSDEVALTGDTAAKVTAAVTAKYPDATIERLETDSDGAAYEAHVTLADGSRATVKLDESFAVTGTETGHR